MSMLVLGKTVLMIIISVQHVTSFMSDMFCYREFDYCLRKKTVRKQVPVSTPGRPDEMSPFEFFSTTNNRLLGIIDSLDTPAPHPAGIVGPIGKLIGPGGKIGLDVDPEKSSMYITRGFTAPGDGEIVFFISLLADDKSGCQFAAFDLKVVYRYVSLDLVKQTADVYKVKKVAADVFGFGKLEVLSDCPSRSLAVGDEGTVIAKSIGGSYVSMFVDNNSHVNIKLTAYLKLDRFHPIHLHFKVLKPTADPIIRFVAHVPSKCPRGRTPDPFVAFSECPQYAYRVRNNKRGSCMSMKFGRGKKMSMDCECMHFFIRIPFTPELGEAYISGVMRVNSGACDGLLVAFFFTWYKISKVSELEVKLLNSPISGYAPSQPPRRLDAQDETGSPRRLKKSRELTADPEALAIILGKVEAQTLSSEDISQFVQSVLTLNNVDSQGDPFPFGVGGFKVMEGDCPEKGISVGDKGQISSLFRNGQALKIKSTSQGLIVKGWFQGAVKGDFNFELECVECHSYGYMRRLQPSDTCSVWRP